MIKAGVDCKHIQRQWAFIPEFSTCHHPSTIRSDPVSGKERETYCKVQREFSVCECGPSGRLFEPRVPWLLRLLSVAAE